MLHTSVSEISIEYTVMDMQQIGKYTSKKTVTKIGSLQLLSPWSLYLLFRQHLPR